MNDANKARLRELQWLHGQMRRLPGMCPDIERGHLYRLIDGRVKGLRGGERDELLGVRTRFDPRSGSPDVCIGCVMAECSLRAGEILAEGEPFTVMERRVIGLLYMRAQKLGELQFSDLFEASDELDAQLELAVRNLTEAGYILDDGGTLRLTSKLEG